MDQRPAVAEEVPVLALDDTAGGAVDAAVEPFRQLAKNPPKVDDDDDDAVVVVVDEGARDEIVVDAERVPDKLVDDADDDCGRDPDGGDERPRPRPGLDEPLRLSNGNGCNPESFFLIQLPLLLLFVPDDEDDTGWATLRRNVSYFAVISSRSCNADASAVFAFANSTKTASRSACIWSVDLEIDGDGDSDVDRSWIDDRVLDDEDARLER